MTKKNRLTPEEIVQSFQNMFPNDVEDPRIERRASGSLKTEFIHIWMRLEKNIFKEAVRHLLSLEQYPHFAVTSGYYLGENIELVYHFSIYYGERAREISLSMTVALPKSNPTIETIADLIPGALISEQEKQEMLGVIVTGIPKDTRVFIADDFPKGVYPWRRDETGPGNQVNNLHEMDP